MANILTGVVPQRLGRRSYRWARWGFGLADLVLLVIALFAATDSFPGGTIAAAAVLLVCAVLFMWTQYRFARLSVARLHDNNISGWFLLPYNLLQIAAWCLIAYACLGTTLPIPNIGAVWTQITENSAVPGHVILLFVWLAIVIYAGGLSIYLRWSDGTAGPNRYGPAPVR